MIIILGQQASRLWTMLKKPMQTTCADNSVGEPAPYLNNEIILELCTIVEGHNDVLGNYCKSLETQGLLGPYKWSDAGVISAVSPCMRAEELMSMMQSREYQVKFCHANITHHRKNSICQDAVPATDKDTTTGYAANQSVLSMNDADEEHCLKSLWKSTLISKLILGIGAAVVVLLIITVALVVALR